MYRTTITRTNDYLHFQRIFLDIDIVRGGLHADYQIFLHGDGIEANYDEMLVSYPQWSESVLALALRVLCQVRWGKQEIKKSRLPSSGISLLDVSVSVSKDGVEPLSELEAVRIYTGGDITTCQYRDVLESEPTREFTLSPGDSDPFYLAAHAISQTLWNTSTLALLPEPVHLRVHQYGEISYVRLSELLPTSRTAFDIHLQGIIKPAIPSEHPNDCAYLQDWKDFLGVHIKPSKRVKDSRSVEPLRLLPTAAAKDAYTSPPYSQVPGEFCRLINFEAQSAIKSKMRRVKYNGEYFARGCSPPEIFKRWDMLENLAYKYALKAGKIKNGKNNVMSEVEILEDVLERLLNGRRGSSTELKWVIRRSAEIIGWPVPPSVIAGMQE